MRARRWLWPGVFLACLLAAGARSIALGKDANWDLKNYHWYNAWAFLNGRRGWDLVPAQLQTFHSPFADLPFHGLVHLLPWPRHVAFWMAASTAVAAFFLLRTLALAYPAGRMRTAAAWIAAAAAIGLTGAAGTAALGTTMNEWPSTALVMAAIFLAVRALLEGEAAHPRAWLAAGFLAGCAVGLKLTYAVFALGLLAAIAFSGNAREAARRTAAAAAAMGAGLAVSYGPWAWMLWREFGNPFFPYFNAAFESPWWHAHDWFDRNFGPRDWRQWIFFPLYFARRSTLVGEVSFRDYRLAALLVLALLCLLKYRLGGLARRLAPGASAPAAAPLPSGEAIAFLAVFTVVSYLSWIKLYGIYRYLVALELVSGALIVACVLYLVRRPPLRLAAVILLACLLVGTTRTGNWGRIAFGEAYFDVAPPELPPRSLVIVGYAHPLAYAIPFFRPDARFVSPANNLVMPGEKHRLARGIEAAIRAHDGPLFILQHRERHAQDEATLRYFGLAAEDATCRPVPSEFSGNAMQVCGLRRIPPPRAFGLAARGQQALGELGEAERAG